MFKNRFSNPAVMLTCIFTAALIIRLIYLYQISEMPTFDNPVMDEKYHLELVEKINSDEGLAEEPFFRAPLYPYFLAFLMKLTSSSLFAVRFLQILLGSLLPLFIYLISIKLFNRSVAFWSSVVAVFYPTFIYFDASLLITFLITLLSLFLVFYLYRYNEKSFLSPLFIGIILGIAGLARPNILLFGPFLFVWLWIYLKPKIGLKKTIIQYLVVALISFLIILPVTIRNYAVSKDIVFIAWQGGMNFYIGNNHLSTGWSATLPGIDKSWEGGYNEAIAYAESSEGRKLKRSEVSDFWFKLTFEDIKQNPGSFVRLFIKKVRLLINGYEIPNNQNIYLAKEFSPLFNVLTFNFFIYFPFGLLIPLAFIGIGFSFRQWKQYLPIYLFLTAYSGSLLLFFVCARFRQPLIPFLIIFAVYAVHELIKLVKIKDIKNISLITLIILLFMWESNHDILQLDQHRVKAEDYHLLGNVFLENGNLAAAEREYKKSVDIDPTFARGFNNLGLVYGRRNKQDEAAKYFEKAIQLDPSVVESYMNYATVEIIGLRYDRAITILELTCSRFPLNDVAALKLAITYFQNGDITKAKDKIQEALRLNPDNPQIQSAYQQIMNAVP